MSKIEEIIAREIKDSSNNLAIEVTLSTEKENFIASVSFEVSDNKEVLKAIENINKIIAPKLKGKNPVNQKEIDELMISLSNAKNELNLKINATLPVSIAVCRAGANSKKLHLYKYISELAGTLEAKIPYVIFSFINGNSIGFKEFMVIPQKKSFSENLAIANRVFLNLQSIINKNYGEVKMGDEGKFALDILKTEQILFLLKNAINNEDALIAIDVAANNFFNNGKYILEKKEFSRQELIDFYKDLAERFNIILIEDPFAKDDWKGFIEATKELTNVIVSSNNLTTTNIDKIKEARSKNACNGIILKINQVRTVSEIIEASNLAKSYGWKNIVSQASAETMDTFISDLAIGLKADFIKSGSPSQPERIIKYNRLLEIESELK